MDKKDLGADPAFPYSTHYNYYSGSSHLQQFPYYDYSMPVDYYSSWHPPSLDRHSPGFSISTESVNDATSGSDTEDDDDCAVVDEVQCSSGRSGKCRKVPPTHSVRYSLKVVNQKKSLSTVHSMPDVTSKFDSIASVRDTIKKFLKCDVTEIGYVSPGHGAKGKYNDLLSDDDLELMYDEYEGRRGIHGVLLWCYRASDGTNDAEDSQIVTKSSQRKRSNSCTKPPTKCAKKINQIEEIVDKLKEKHSGLYSLEQYNCWAHTIDMGKHNSYVSPPDLPFFVGKKVPTCTASASKLSTPVVATAVVTQESPGSSQPQSPGKRIRYRGECMDQLTKWHSLMEKGIITEEQYQGFVGKILNDIEKM